MTSLCSHLYPVPAGSHRTGHISIQIQIQSIKGLNPFSIGIANLSGALQIAKSLLAGITDKNHSSMLRQKPLLCHITGSHQKSYQISRVISDARAEELPILHSQRQFFCVRKTTSMWAIKTVTGLSSVTPIG